MLSPTQSVMEGSVSISTEWVTLAEKIISAPIWKRIVTANLKLPCGMSLSQHQLKLLRSIKSDQMDTKLEAVHLKRAG